MSVVQNQHTLYIVEGNHRKVKQHIIQLNYPDKQTPTLQLHKMATCHIQYNSTRVLYNDIEYISKAPELEGI